MIQTNTYAQDNGSPKETMLSPKEVADIAQHFSGMKADREPKGLLSYSFYDFDAPDNDIDKQTIFVVKGARLELSMDHMTGFYILDVIFNSSANMSLRDLWAHLQRHKSNQVYAGNKTWICFMKLIQNLSDEEEAKSTTTFTANIMNPLSFYLIRTIPIEDEYGMDSVYENKDTDSEEDKDSLVRENKGYEVENDDGSFCEGNTIRILLHPSLVQFQYESDSDAEPESSDETESAEDTE